MKIKYIKLLLPSARRQFSSSSIKLQLYSKPGSVPKEDLEFRRPLPSDIVDVTKACLDIWEGTSPHPDNFLRVLKANKNASSRVVVHKPSNRVITSLMSVRSRAPPLPLSHSADPPDANFSPPIPGQSQDGYEICMNACYTHPQFRSAHVSPYCMKEATRMDLKDLGELPLRYTYTTFDDFYAIGSPNMGPHRGPDSNCIAASNFLLYECSFKKLDELINLTQKFKSSGKFPDISKIDTKVNHNMLQPLIMAGQQLETIPFPDVYDNVRNSPYLTQLLMAGRYWSTDFAPLPFHPENFTTDLNPYGATVLVGRDAPTTKSSASHAIGAHNIKACPVSSLSSACTFWMPGGVCFSQFSSAVTVEQTMAHIVRTLSEARERLDQAQRSRPLETYPSSFFTTKEISALPKWVVVSPTQKLDKFLALFFFSLSSSRNKVDHFLQKMIGMEPKTMDQGHEVKRIYIVRTTSSHPSYPS